MRVLSILLILFFLIGSANKGYAEDCPDFDVPYTFTLEPGGFITVWRNPPGIRGSRRWHITVDHGILGIDGVILSAKFKGGSAETGCHYDMATNTLNRSRAVTARRQ